jgi:hypothetical protein
MSIYAIKLSTWIDKDDPKCDYKSYVKMALKFKWTCDNPKCGKRLHYGMITQHSAVVGYGDRPCCSWKCWKENPGHSTNGRVTKKKQKRASLNLVASLQAMPNIGEDLYKRLPGNYGVTQEEVDEYVKTWNGKCVMDEIFMRRMKKGKKL